MATHTYFYVSTFQVGVINAVYIMNTTSLATLWQAPHSQGEISLNDIMITVWIGNYIHVK